MDGQTDEPLQRMKAHIDRTVREVVCNAERLLNDARCLEFCEPPTSAWFLVAIAQEELAKAFILCLTVQGILPWNPHLFRALQDHKCKQLTCVVMDYVTPDLEEFLNRCAGVAQLPTMPARVADALNILRHEKIGRWMSNSWCWAEDPHYDQDALGIAEGKQDRLKQDALYVRLGKDGSVVSTPTKHTHANLDVEMERAKRFKVLVEDLHSGAANPGLNWHDVRESFRLLFTDVPVSG